MTPAGDDAAPSGPFDRRLLAHAGAARPAIAGTVAVGLVSTAASAAQAILLAALLAGVFARSRSTPPPTLLGAGLAAAFAVRAACGLASEVVGRHGAGRVKAELRAALAATGLSLSGDPLGAGELATLAGRGLDALDAYVGRCVPDLVLAGAAPALLLVALGLVDWLSALVVVVAIALFPLFGALVGWTTTERARRRWAEVAALGDHLVDLFEGLPVLRAHARTGRERARIEEMGERIRVASMATLRVAFLSGLVLDTLASVATALVAVPVGLRLVAGSIPLAHGLAALLLTPEVFVPLRRATAEFHESAEGRAAASRALDRIEAVARPSSPGPAAGAVGGLPPGPPSIALRSVTVARPGRPAPVLDGVTLDVAPGETVVLVGANGAGKSTILALVLGLVDPTSGEVRVGGLDLVGVDARAVRLRCSTLTDRPTLLPATLGDNLRVACPEAGPAALERALADAGLEGLVERLPAGLTTPVGEGGFPLSAGERQRVALARALVRDADCYLLDEPTAHLDDATEAAVVERLRRRLEAATAVVVTHRPAVLALGDRVLRLREGRLVEVEPA